MQEAAVQRGEIAGHPGSSLPVATVLVLGTFAVPASACGAPRATLGVAHLGSPTTSAPASAAATPEPFQGLQQEYQYELADAQCKRSHGVASFPDPKLTSHPLQFDNGSASSAPGYASANNACKHFLPDEGGPPSAAQLAAEAAKLLKFSECMRAQGEPSFPDPILDQSEIGFSLKGIDASSPRFSAARERCSAFAPGRSTSDRRFHRVVAGPSTEPPQHGGLLEPCRIPSALPFARSAHSGSVSARGGASSARSGSSSWSSSVWSSL